MKTISLSFEQTNDDAALLITYFINLVLDKNEQYNFLNNIKQEHFENIQPHSLSK